MKRGPPSKDPERRRMHFFDEAKAMARKPTQSGVLRAAKKISTILPPTPLLPLVVGGTTVWCKCESAQPMGAFKLRGAWHRLTDMTADEARGGVVAFSSGNHAQGVAWAARRLGMSATIVMPSDAPKIKVDGTRALGADVVFYDRMTGDRAGIARMLADRKGAVLVPSYDDAHVIEGQGSAGVEAAAQMAALGLAAPDLIVSPCGGGGLSSGLALALPEAAVVIVEPDGWDDMGQSLRGGAIVPVGLNPPPTRCDALQTLRVSPLTFDVLSGRGAQAVSVSEDEVAAAMRLAFEQLGLVIEPGGAVGLAAVMAGKVVAGERTLLILSGGNVEPELFDALVRV
jgi:threonine dehydratase